jgi:hypothetical protein
MAALAMLLLPESLGLTVARPFLAGTAVGSPAARRPIGIPPRAIG